MRYVLQLVILKRPPLFYGREESLRCLCREERAYYVYIFTGSSGTLYTGATNSIRYRVWQHKDMEHL